ncbi:MAG: hypothetical protein JWP29_4203 [Rhodoferax sp.]|nr:hypothetical protein [Rhodoferax sp.]
MAVLYGLLAVASLGGMLATKSGNPLRAQINAWWLIFPVVSLSLVSFPMGPVLLVLLIALLAVRELAALCALPRERRRFVGWCLGLLALQTGLSWYRPGLAVGVLAVLLLLQSAWFLGHRRPGPLLLQLFALLLLALSFLPMLLGRPASTDVNQGWYFYLFVLTALNDIGQFIAGTTLGRHRIAARISPQKTWQGLAGGVLVSVAVSLALGLYLELANAAQLVLLALLLAPGGFAGDLLFSAAKRWLGIKDFSNLIPGHGGMLDRVDSLVLTAPLLYLALAACPLF